jgi:hypothetical protein
MNAKILIIAALCLSALVVRAEEIYDTQGRLVGYTESRRWWATAPDGRTALTVDSKGNLRNENNSNAYSGYIDPDGWGYLRDEPFETYFWVITGGFYYSVPPPAGITILPIRGSFLSANPQSHAWTMDDFERYYAYLVRR